MTKTKNASRVLSLVLALIMVLGVAVPVMAAEPIAGTEVDSVVVKGVTAEPTDDDPGTSYTVTLPYDTDLDDLTSEDFVVTAKSDASVGKAERTKDGTEDGTEDGGHTWSFVVTNKAGDKTQTYTVLVQQSKVPVTTDTPNITKASTKQEIGFTAKVEPTDSEDDTSYNWDAASYNWDAVGNPENESIKNESIKKIDSAKPNKATLTVPADYVGTITVTATVTAKSNDTSKPNDTSVATGTATVNVTEQADAGIKFTFTVEDATTTNVNSNNSIVEILEYDVTGTNRTVDDNGDEKPAIIPTFDGNTGSVAAEQLADPSGEETVEGTGEGMVEETDDETDETDETGDETVQAEKSGTGQNPDQGDSEDPNNQPGQGEEEPGEETDEENGYVYKLRVGGETEETVELLKVVEESGSNAFYTWGDATGSDNSKEPTRIEPLLAGANNLGHKTLTTYKVTSPTGVTITPSNKVLSQKNSDQNVQFSATVAPSEAQQGVSWKVDPDAVTAGVEVSEAGHVTVPAEYEGKITVTATSNADNSKSANAILEVVAGTSGPRDTKFELFFRNIDKAGFLNPKAVKDALGTQGRVQIVAIRDDNNTLADNGRLFDTKDTNSDDAFSGDDFGTEGQAEFELILNDFKNTKIVAIVNQGDSAESYPTVVETLFEINNKGEIKAVGETVRGSDKAYVVTLQTESDPDARNIKVMFDGDPIPEVRLVYEEIDRDGNVEGTLLTTTSRTDRHGYIEWFDPITINEGRTTEMAHASNKPFSKGSVEVDGIEIDNGNGIKITPVRVDVEENSDASWDPDNSLIFYPWTQFQELDEAGRAMGYVAKDTTKGIANPYVIDYGMVEYDVNIKAYTSEGTGDQPVVGSTFSVYQLKDNGELGNKLNSGKTNQDGIASFKIPTEGTQVVYIDGAFRIISTPYVLVQEDGGDDKAVIPYGGYIYLTGSYMDEIISVNDDELILSNLNTVETSAVDIRFDDDTFNIEVLNSRDGIARLESDDIYKNSVEVAQAAYPNGLVKDKFEGYKNVVIATAENGKLADALTAGSVAALYDAPLLVVDEDNLADDVAKYIDDAGADRAIIVGGPNTVSDRVASQLETITGRVKRFQGENRFETAAAVAKDVLAKSDNNTVILANGQANEKFADALAVSSVAGKYNYPVLLTDYDKLVPATQKALEDLDIEKVYVIGGDNTISEETVRQVNNVASVTTVERVAGDTRFDTAVEIAKKFYPDATQAVYVNGEDNVLALIAGPFAETKDAPVILVGNDVPQSVEEYIPASKITQGYLVGDDSSITDEVRRELSNLMDENR